MNTELARLDLTGQPAAATSIPNSLVVSDEWLRADMRKVVLPLALLCGAYSVLSFDGASAQPVLMLNEPRDVDMAKYSCGWAEAEIKSSQISHQGVQVR